MIQDQYLEDKGRGKHQVEACRTWVFATHILVDDGSFGRIPACRRSGRQRRPGICLHKHGCKFAKPGQMNFLLCYWSYNPCSGLTSG